jgi:DnaJ-domain-containing protein 1
LRRRRARSSGRGIGIDDRAPGAGPARSAPRHRAAAARHRRRSADRDAVKRAYRRLARALHPDLQPGADEARRRTLERRFAELTAVYDALV